MSFFFNDTATTEIYTLPLHDALPIFSVIHRPALLRNQGHHVADVFIRTDHKRLDHRLLDLDRKSTRLNSSHVSISYAVFCLKKKKKNNTQKNTSAVHTIIATK